MTEVAAKLKYPKTPEEVDELIEEYETAVVDQETLKTRVQMLKDNLVAIVDKCGSAPATATASKRLQGIRKSVLVTWSKKQEVVAEGVAALRTFLEGKGLAALLDKLFPLQPPPVYVPPPPSYRRGDDVWAVLGGMPQKLHKGIQAKIALLCAEAIKTKSSAPSVKVEDAKTAGK